MMQKQSSSSSSIMKTSQSQAQNHHQSTSNETSATSNNVMANNVSAAQMSTPSDQSARSSLTGSNTSTNYSKGVTKVVVVNLAHGSSGKGKKSKRGKGGAVQNVHYRDQQRHHDENGNNKRSSIMANANDLIMNDGVTTTQTSSSNASVEMTPQRSRSEAPTENSIGNVLYEVHKKLMNRGRKLSPAKIQAKQQERQQKAEDLRAKIELSRQEWFKKVQQRQQLARARSQETVERKRLNLHERLEQAARNKEAELQNVVEKAKAENVKAEETNFIIKLTKQNEKLDLNHKLSEREERRKMLASKDMARIKGQGLKREAAEKRREEISEEMRFKVMSKEQKREQAEQRRKEQQIAEKNKAMADKMKRDLVRQRVRRHKISDIMSFVSNRESLWEFIGMEQDLDSMGLQLNLGDAETLNALDDSVDGGVHNLNENELLSMIQQDQFELEKLMLKRDHEILSTCIVEEPDGTIKILKSPMSLLYRGGPKSSSSSTSLDSTDEKKGPSQLHANKIRGGATKNAFQIQPKPTTPSSNHQQKHPINTSCKVVGVDFSPMKQSSAQQPSTQTAAGCSKEQQSTSTNNSNNAISANSTNKTELRKLKFAEKQHSQSFRSSIQSTSTVHDANEDRDSDCLLRSKDEIMTQDGNEEIESKGQAQSSIAMVSELESKSCHTLKEDEKIEQKLHQQRVKVAMRRNILKRNASEDLVWAAELQSNPNFDMVRFIGQGGDVHYQQAIPGSLKQLETRSQASSLERNSFDGLEDEIGTALRESSAALAETPPKGESKLGKTSAAHLSKRNKKQGGGKHNQSSRSSLHSTGPNNLHGVSGGSKDLGTNLINSNRGKRNSIQDLQQTFTAKQKKTLSNQGSCSSLSSLIKTKLRQEENEEFSDTKGGQTHQGTLSQAQLEQLGPVVKMTINGFPFSQNTWVNNHPTANTANCSVGGGNIIMMPNSPSATSGSTAAQNLSSIGGVGVDTSSMTTGGFAAHHQTNNQQQQLQHASSSQPQPQYNSSSQHQLSQLSLQHLSNSGGTYSSNAAENQHQPSLTSGILSEHDGRMMMMPQLGQPVYGNSGSEEVMTSTIGSYMDHHTRMWMQRNQNQQNHASQCGNGVLASSGMGMQTTNSSSSSMAIQMNQLIISQRPVPSKTNLSSVQYTSSNMSKNANQLLFPIREQKIILMYKERGPKLDFVQAKINLKLEEVRLLEKDSNSSTNQLMASGGNQGAQGSSTSTSTTATTTAQPQQQYSTPQQTVSSKKANLDATSVANQSNSGTATDLQQPQSQITASPVTPQKNSHRSQHQSGKDNQNNTSSSLLSIEETKKTPTKGQQQATQIRTNTPTSGKKPGSAGGGGNHLSTHKTTPGENSLLSSNDTTTATAGNNTARAIAPDADNVIVEGCGGGLDDSSVDDVMGHQQSDRMVNLIVKKLLIDQMQHIRIDDSQKSILFDKDKDSQAVLKYLEVNELKFGYCRLCEVAIFSEYSASSDAEKAKAHSTIREHFQSRAHVRKRDGLSIKESEDTAFSLLVFCSQPGDIDVELRKENEKALKRKVKRLKASMQALAVGHENASTYPGKELKSSNKNRLQIRCIELQKSVFPDIKFDTVEAILNDVVKVLEKRGAGDLHLMRKLKFVPTMVDNICKRITTCPRGKLGALAKVINLVIKILSKFCTMRENRNYMIQTNRVMPLIELLSWCLNRQTELFFGIEFMPGLFQTITTHLKHRVPYECQLLKEHMVDLLICSQIPAKLKNKLAIVKSIQSNENEDSLGQVPFFLLKSVAFLEALTAQISIDARTRPVYEKSIKIGEHVFFVLQSTELLGITQMITTLLLTCNETFKASDPSSASSMVLPQTILSLTIFSIKVLNNLMRMDIGIVQHMTHDLNEQLYHLLSFILSYTETNIDESDDVKELLHETLIFIGYFCLLNEANQKTLQRGENSILQKLCNLPFTYFMDKKLKDILFPTLITASYHNERSVAIMDQEMNMSEFLVKYIETNISEELPKIMEQEQEYFSDHTKSMSSFGRARSPSQHSTGSNSNQSVQMDFLSGNNPYLPLVMRFPKNLWKDAAQYFKSKAD